MNVGLVNGFSNIANGEGALKASEMNSDFSKFQNLVNSMQKKEKNSTISSRRAMMTRVHLHSRSSVFS